jgi:hypothetical protein
MKVVRLSASRTGRLYPSGMFLVLIFNRGRVEPRAMVRSEGNMEIQPGIDPGTVRLVAQRLNHYATPGPHTCSTIHIQRGLLYLQDNSTANGMFQISSNAHGLHPPQHIFYPLPPTEHAAMQFIPSNGSLNMREKKCTWTLNHQLGSA